MMLVFLSLTHPADYLSQAGHDVIAICGDVSDHDFGSLGKRSFECHGGP